MRASQRTNLATSGDRAGRGTADIDGDLALMVLRFVGSSLDAGCNIGPCTVVEWLLLTPNDFGVRVLVEVRCDLHPQHDTTMHQPPFILSVAKE